ncbi:MAG: hypothetical protein NVS3B17_23720 [Vulcanimicrobiaceae bacterium]
MNSINLFTSPEAAREAFAAAESDVKTLYDYTDENVEWSAVRIPEGTQNGHSSVIFQFVFSDGPDNVVLRVQTTLALLDGLVSAYRGAEERDRYLKLGIDRK